MGVFEASAWVMRHPRCKACICNGESFTSHTAHVTVHFSGGMPKPSQQLAAVCMVLQRRGCQKGGLGKAGPSPS